MKVKMTFFAVALLAAASLMAFGGVKFVKTWKNPEAQPVDWRGKKVAVFAMTALTSNREGAEKAMAREITQRGAQAVLGYTLVPPAAEKDLQAAKRILADAGITGAIISRVVGYQEDMEVSGGQSYYLGPNYASFWGYWDYGMTVGYIPGNVDTKMTVMVESLIYSIDQDKLLWAGTSATVNPKEVDKAIKQLASAVANEVRKAGLVKK